MYKKIYKNMYNIMFFRKIKLYLRSNKKQIIKAL